MSPATDQARQQAEQRTQETRSFMRQVRAASRRKYTPVSPAGVKVSKAATENVPLA